LLLVSGKGIEMYNRYWTKRKMKERKEEIKTNSASGKSAREPESQLYYASSTE
jgi:hypothetical protein